MGVSRPTEMTIRDLLQEELRKRGVTVVPEFLCGYMIILNIEKLIDTV
jgi:hypothetical protein